MIRAVIRRLFASSLLAALLMALTLPGLGCAKRHRIFVESDTAWLGVIDQDFHSAISDSGNATFRVAGEIHCMAVTKTHDVGYVRVRIDEGPWAETTLPRGRVETCR